MSEQKENFLDGIDSSKIQSLSVGDLLSQDLLFNLYELDLAERARVRALLLVTAKSHGIEKELKTVLKAYDAEDERLGREYINGQNNTTDFSFNDMELACGAWIANDNGVKMQKKDGEIVYASRIPLVPSALLENISTGTEKVKILFLKNGKKELICERSVTASASNIVKLADKGLEVNSENAKMLVRYISDVIAFNLDSLPCLKAASQLGWSDYGFVPFASDVVFDGERENKHLFSAISQKGKFGLWKDLMSKLRANKYIRLIMAASFASVLIEKVGALPFVFHLWGGTGTGKTVALMVAMSIWGNPSPGKTVRTMNMTQNSMLSTAAFLNSLPFAGDELQTIKSKWDNYDQLIMRITEGIDRGRMSYDKNNEIKSWRCSFIFTGEEPCTKSGSGGGVKNRVIEVEISAPLFKDVSGNEVANFVRKNYGHAGKLFIDYISTVEDLPQRFSKLSSSVMQSVDTTEKQASSMALMILADEIACECIFTDEKPLTVSECIEFLSSEKEVDISERAYEFIINHIAQNMNRFNVTDNKGEIWGAVREDKEILFNASVLKRELSANGFEFDAVKKKWADKGYLIKNPAGRYIHCTAVNGSKANYIKLCFVGNFAQIKDEEDPDEDDIPFMCD